jgi:hypothetical protein
MQIQRQVAVKDKVLQELTQATSSLAEDRFEYPHQGFGQLILQVISGIDGYIVLKNVEWILRLFVCGRTCQLLVSII